jgi:hypothetical protein
VSIDDRIESFGPFSSVFPAGELSVPGHLPLLGLHGPEVDVVLDRIAVALAHEPRPGIEALLRARNWRPHLVAACAYLLDDAHKLDPDLLWGAVDQGSWVAPQLVVTALFVDPEFASRARARIAACCRASATSRAREAEPIAKNVASLLAASRFVPSLATWHATAIADAEVAAVQRADDAQSHAAPSTQRGACARP